ncbi:MULTISPECIES: MarR family winged helix-turn-helix transcriptional regulator [Anaerotruncus]|jgi:DNA-binding MarR family transcriptional regulator|uniref:MarR family transcriptional regulator n=2 Tax=Anaerotruncus colihominis TaxID=169435 RepID=A0A845SZT0_9FIRM|nr:MULTISPECIES: MarR family transcriptional regulator [Anaerotruncus]MCI8491789.1 MarR family transcriptional regulator [Anaerotruncus sp.]MCR2025266.1 MarR family transcriptional regulator [Anaerotruncus colihominis]NDO40438.1 MarR family transcriptional regulator [Anaerotruncus colihominis]
MSRTAEFLINIRSIIKLHESMLREICGEYKLALIEATIVSFLHNNPGKDTAADIVELRMLSKGNVSQAVESLIQRSLLRREQDAADRRRIHLFLTPAAEPIIQSMERLWARFEDEIFAGLSRDERAIFERVNDRISANTRQAMAGRIRK